MTQRLERILPLVLIGMCALSLFIGAEGFPYPFQGNYSDLTISHHPNFLWIRESLARWGVVPLWSPLILSGYPFSANPLSSLFYPPAWLLWVLPLPLGYHLVTGMHLLLGGLGTARLIRRIVPNPIAAWVGACLFVLMPKLAAHMGAGHLTLVWAVCWTPWLMEWTEQAHGQTRFVWQPHLAVGLGLGLTALADVRWAAYFGLYWVGVYGWSVIERAAAGRKVGGKAAAEAVGVLAKGAAVQVGLAAALAAAVLLPLGEFSRLSTRAAMSGADRTAFSLESGRLLNLVVPNFGGYAEWIFYPGILAVLLAWVGVFSRSNRCYQWIWAVVFALAVMFSLGDQLPLARVLGELPGLNLLRVPARALFFADLAVIVLAAVGLNDLLTEPARRSRWLNLTLAAWGGMLGVFGVGMGAVVRPVPAAFVWAGVLGIAGTLLIFLRLYEKIRPLPWLGIVFLVIMGDLLLNQRSLMRYRPEAEVAREGAATAQYLAGKPGTFRIYSPSYSIPQHSAAAYRLELADGVDPLQWAAYADYFDSASGVPRSRYGVTLPPFEQGDPAEANRMYTPNAERLGRLNVRYVAAEYPVDAEGLILDRVIGTTWVYENTLACPRAWVESAETPDCGAGGKAVRWVRREPNQIWLEAEGPGLLVLSEMNYPGWQVFVDGEAAEGKTAEGVFRSVMLPSGSHTVQWVYRSRWVYMGGAISLLSVVGAALGLLWARKEREHG